MLAGRAGHRARWARCPAHAAWVRLVEVEKRVVARVAARPADARARNEINRDARTDITEARAKQLKKAYPGQGRANYLRNKSLMDLIVCPPLLPDQMDIRPGAFNRDGVKALCERLMFRSILELRMSIINRQNVYVLIM